MPGFSTLIWLICTLWVVVVFWRITAEKRFPFLLVVATVALAAMDWRSVIVAAIVTCITYVTVTRDNRGSMTATLGIGAIAAILIGFKLISGPIGGDDITDIIIPLGLSYYALRAIHVILEDFKGRIGQVTPMQLASYMIFVPTLVSGPIHRYPDFERDMRRHRWDEALFVEGADRLIHGFFKIVILYNIVVVFGTTAVLDAVGPERAQLALYVSMVSIGIGLYVQFSGYSDIAIGFARMLGIKVMENFDYPYFKSNISAFWRSWHISLTSWSREYIYGSTVALTRSPALGAIAALVFVGIWHEASLRYLLWGAYHGLGIVVWQQFQAVKVHLPAVENPVLAKLLHALSILATLHFVWLGFLLVREDTPAEMWATLLKLLGGV